MAQRSQQIYDLFTGVKRYRIPLYQRRYVWSKANGDALWRDFIQLEGKKHFTGTIITKSEGIDNQDMIVIDGQQRLITLQIIFRLSQDLWQSEKYTPSVGGDNLGRLIYKVESYTQLYTGDINSDGNYRLLMTKENDKKAFQSVISGELWEQEIASSKFPISNAFNSLLNKGFNEKGEQSNQHLIITAYGYFGTQITNHLNEKGSDELVRLIDVLENRFHVISANLETDDDPQQAYGSSNDTGVALDEFDLLRNDMFLRVKDSKTQDCLYEEYWKVFDDNPFWQEKPGRTDEFLRDFLMAKLGPINFGKNRLFHDLYKGQYHKKLEEHLEEKIKRQDYIQHHKKLEERLGKKKLEKHLGKTEFVEFVELTNYAKVYQKMEDPTTNIGRRRQFYKDLNIIFENLDLTSLPPFLLAVENELELDNKECDQVYKILESYILRCQLAYGVNEDKTTSLRINALFSSLDLFSRLIKNNEKSIEKFNPEKFKIALVDSLSSGSVPVKIWMNMNMIVTGLLRVGQQIASGKKFSVALAELLSSHNVPGRSWLNNNQVLSGLRKVGHQIENGSSSARRPVWDMLRYIFYRIECLKREPFSTEAKAIELSFENFSAQYPWYVRIKTMSNSLNPKTSYSLGNLTFCEEHVPAHLSFPERKEILLREPNARLTLNKEIAEYPEWDVKQILEEREKNLLTYLHKIWPSAEYFTQKQARPEVASRWLSMIQLDEYQLTRFVTYTGSEELSKIQVIGEKVIGTSQKGKETLQKPNVLFACSAEAWPEVEPYIEILDYVKKEGLQPIQNQFELLEVKDQLLTSAQQAQVQAISVTRCGHVLAGTIEDFDEDAIYMQIREHTVIVYRNGIYEFAIEELHRGVVTHFNKSRGFGFIKSSEHDGIYVHISEVLDRNINELQLSQKVKFDLNQTTKGEGLSAINVELVEN